MTMMMTDCRSGDDDNGAYTAALKMQNPAFSSAYRCSYLLPRRFTHLLTLLKRSWFHTQKKRLTKCCLGT